MKQQGKAFPDSLIRQVRDAWAAGEFGSDAELAHAFDIDCVGTLRAWRRKHAPDGIPWTEVREQTGQASLDIVVQRLGENHAEATLRQIQLVREGQETVGRYIYGEALTLANGDTVTVPKVEPKSLGEAVSAYVQLVTLERKLRGDPDVRLDYYMHLFGFVVGEVGKAFCAQHNIPASALDGYVRLFDEKMTLALRETGESASAPG